MLLLGLLVAGGVSLIAGTETIPAADNYQCVFTQTCDNSPFGPPCFPTAKVYDPTPYNFPDTPLQCPEYANSSCCNDYQNRALQFNFQLIGATFGSAAGGNGACVANMKNLWCAFTCAPDQSRFIQTNGYANMSSSGIIYEVLLTTYNLDKNWACGVFESCKDTSIAELAGFASCEQFLDYQMTESISRGSYSNFVFHEPGTDNDSMAMPLYDCCSYPDNLDNSSIPLNQVTNVSTPCAYCSGMCGGQDMCYTTGKSGTSTADANSSVVIPSGDALAEVTTAALYGFEVVPIVVIYGIIFFGSAWILLYRWLRANWEKRRGPRKEIPKGRGTMVSMQPVGPASRSYSYEPPSASLAHGSN
jgi:Niemann-Pick C1 N terminus